MKVAIYIAGWIIGYLISLFSLMLWLRLHGLKPNDVYKLDTENFSIYALLILIWPLCILTIIFYFIFFKFIRFIFKPIKIYFISGIELIVAKKELKEGKKDGTTTQ